jgi:hypothetical protein
MCDDIDATVDELQRERRAVPLRNRGTRVTGEGKFESQNARKIESGKQERRKSTKCAPR